MLWFWIAILSYFFFALVSLIDRYMLVGPLRNPKVYAFYVSIWGLLTLVFVPFGLATSNPDEIVFALLSGMWRTFALFLFYRAASKIEISRVVPAVGGFLPVFTFIIVQIGFGQKEPVSLLQILSLGLLILGSVLISSKKFGFRSLLRKDIKYPILAAAAFAIGFYLIKQVFIQQSFISGLIWSGVGGGLGALLFLLFPKTRKTIFLKKPILKKQTFSPLMVGYFFGGIASLLQNYSVFLVKEGQLAFINALEGTKYVFLFFFTLFLSWKFPQFFKEDISKKAIIQKVLSIFILGAGLFLFFVK